ncbi:MAG: thermonuclease family protein [Brevinematia bacterium]
MRKIFIFILLFSCHLNVKSDNLFVSFSASVEKIIDGDTIIVNSLENLSNFSIFSNQVYVVRLLYIDAPETKENERFERFLDKLYKKEIFLKRNEIIELGNLALSNLSNILKKDDIISVSFNPQNQFDNYGRILALVYKDKININLYQVETGYAFCYFYNQKKDKKFINAENIAKKNKKGLWKYFN